MIKEKSGWPKRRGEWKPAMRFAESAFKYPLAMFWIMLLFSPAPAQWQNIAIDTLTRDGIRKASGRQSLDLDFLGNSHAAWRQQTGGGSYIIQYTTDSPDGNWRSPVTVSDSAQNASMPALAVSPSDDSPYIVYESGDSIYIAYGYDQGWSIEPVSSSDQEYYGSTIAIDETGVVHLAWTAWLGDPTGYKIAYACGSEGQWEEQILENSYLGEYGSGASPFIDVTTTGQVHILYRGGDYGQYHIHHAWNDSLGGSDWQYELVYSGNVNDFSASLVIDPENNLHAVMSGNDGWGFPSRTYYSRKLDGSYWETAELVSLQEAGTTPSIGLDIMGKPHVAWMGISGNILTGYIYYSYKDDSGTWQDYQLAGDDYFEPCLRVDHFGIGKMISLSGGNTSVYDIYHISGDVATAIKGEDGLHEAISAYKLWQNYPNPFNDETVINFSIPRAGHVDLRVYDIMGRKVATLLDDFLPAGEHELKWNSSEIATGIYFYYLEFEQTSLNGKAILLK